MNTSTTERRARSGAGRCKGCNHAFRPGDTYLEHIRSGRGWRHVMLECVTCAARNGRGPLAQPEDSPAPLYDAEGIA